MPPSNYGHSDIPNFVTMGCEAQFQTGFLGFVTGIRDRRYPVIDEERQTVLAFAFFDHDGSIRSIPLSTGQTFKVPPYFSSPRTLEHRRRLQGCRRKLRLIEAALTESPYGMKSVLDTPPPAAARVEPTTACDQACARSLSDGVLAAMIARDPSKAPLASSTRYTENGQPLPVGEGLWKTLTARGSYNIYLAAGPDADPAFFGSIVETDIPGQLSLRLRQQGGASPRSRRWSSVRRLRCSASSLAPAPCSRRHSWPTSTRRGSRRPYRTDCRRLSGHANPDRPASRHRNLLRKSDVCAGPGTTPGRRVHRS